MSAIKINESKNEGLAREYKVSVSKEAIDAKMSAKLKVIGQQAKVPGFRPGHIPANILKQRYGASVTGEVVDETVREAAMQVVKEHKLKPAMQPKFEIEKFEDGGDMEFSMKVEVLPEIPSFDFSKLSLDRQTFEVADSEIDEAITRLADRNKTLKEVNRAAKNGDTVNIDFTGKLDGVPFEGGSSKHFNLTLGSNQFIPGFEEQLVGVKAGDAKTVKVSFPKDYHKEDLAGKPTEFDIVVHKVQESEAPEVTEELAKKFGFESLEKMKNAVRAQIEGDYTGMQRQKLKKQLFDQLDEQMNFEVPEGMVKAEFDAIWQQFQQGVKRGEMMMDKSEEELKDDYQNVAERRVRLGLILADIGQREKLNVTKEEIAAAVMAQARQFPGQEKMVLEFYQKNPHSVEDLRGPILEDKAVDFLFGTVKMNDKKVSIEELMREEEETDSKPKAKKAKKKSAE